MTLIRPFQRVTLALCAWAIGALAVAHAQQPEVSFGGAYSELGDRRQQLIDNWVARFTKTTGQQVEAGPFYDNVLALSTKTTFEAVTHALMTTALTDRTGASLGDALALVDRVDSVRGEVEGPLEYGEGFGMNVRFKTRSGEAAVLRGLWRKENATWRITSYEIEQP